MRIFKIHPAAVEMWIHQNAAELIETAPGCLIDSCVYACKHGVAFFMETYLTPWTSGHTVTFFRHNETDCPEYSEMWRQIERLQDEADAG